MPLNPSNFDIGSAKGISKEGIEYEKARSDAMQAMNKGGKNDVTPADLREQIRVLQDSFVKIKNYYVSLPKDPNPNPNPGQPTHREKVFAQMNTISEAKKLMESKIAKHEAALNSFAGTHKQDNSKLVKDTVSGALSNNDNSFSNLETQYKSVLKDYMMGSSPDIKNRAAVLQLKILEQKKQQEYIVGLESPSQKGNGPHIPTTNERALHLLQNWSDNIDKVMKGQKLPMQQETSKSNTNNAPPPTGPQNNTPKFK